MTDALAWALVVHRSPQWLTAQLGDLDDLPLEAWAITEGDEDAALFSYDVGSEGVDAELARSLSASGELVYDVRLAEELASVQRFEGGAYAGDVDAEPHDFLATRGFDVVPRGTPVRARSVIVVEGAAPGEVAAALELQPDEALHVEPVRAGTVVSSDAGDVSPLLRLVAQRLPTRTVYLLAHLPRDHFLAQAMRGDADLGVLYDPPGDDPQLPALSSVRGARDAVGIARVLGVSEQLLGLPGHWPTTPDGSSQEP